MTDDEQYDERLKLLATGVNNAAVAFVDPLGRHGDRARVGSIGSPERLRDDHHPDEQAAIVAAAKLEKSRRRRGYV